MRAGKLDRRIIIERQTVTVDAAGDRASAWAPVSTLRAEVVNLLTDETARDPGASTDSIIMFRVRFREDVTTSDRIVLDGRHHNICEVREIGRRRALEIKTVTRGAS